MDTSDIYIAMCEKAKEIQLEHTIYELGDFYYSGRSVVVDKPEIILATAINAGKKRALLDLKIWLPRQDQLQQMIGNYNEQCNAIYSYIMAEVLSPTTDLKSMEQIWLKTVMKVKYNKVWEGSDWISET
jgi:hypothetical protein